MAKLSITSAWNEAADFVKREFGPLLLIAFGLAVLPSIILQVLLPGMMAPTVQPGGVLAPPQLSGGRMALFLVAFLVIFVLSLWGNLTITLLALRRQGVIGDAFRSASGRILPLIGASLLLGIGLFILCLPLVAMFGSSIANGRTPGGGFVLLIFVYVILFFFIFTRLMLMTPVAAAEAIGPIGIIRRAWALSSGHFWKLLGFFLLLMIAIIVIMMVVGALFGILIALLFGAPTPGSLASVLVLLVSGVVQAVFVMVFATMLARIYEQLSGSAASTAQVFE
jgi:hypothetical protein